MKIFTIGFTKKSAETFFTRLKNAGVKRLIDVRLNNVSQLAGFTKKDDLRYFTKALCNIDYFHLPELAPTLIRWNPPPGAPLHLSVSLARLGDAGRGDSLVVVSPQVAPDRLLERVSDARKGGATILALDRGDRRLADMAHEELTVAPSAPLTFDAVQHLVSAAAGERSEQRRGLRARLARLLDTVSGPVSP